MKRKQHVHYPSFERECDDNYNPEPNTGLPEEGTAVESITEISNSDSAQAKLALE
jgi:hypothetical protein